MNLALTPIKLTEGQAILFEDKQWFVKGQKDHKWLLMPSMGGSSRSVQRCAINLAFYTGKAELISSSAKTMPTVRRVAGEGKVAGIFDYDGLPKAERELHHKRIKYVDAFLNAPPGFRSGRRLMALLQECATELGDTQPHPERVVRRWAKKYLACGRDGRGLVNERYIRIVKRRKAPDHRLTMILNTAFKIYKQTVGAKISHAVKAARDLIKAQNLEIKANAEFDEPEPLIWRPCRATLYNIFKQMIDPTAFGEKHGANVKRSFYRHVRGKIKASYPLELVQMDSTELDWFLKVPGVEEAVRPWITLLIDVYSRQILGFYLGYGSITAETTLSAIAMAVNSKDWIENEYNGRVKGKWLAYGLIYMLQADNGVEGCLRVQYACSDVQIGFQTTQVKQAWANGIIERLHGKVSVWTQQFEGASCPDPRKKDEKLPDKNPVFTFEQAKELIVKFIVEDYQHTPINGISPAKKWADGVEAMGGIQPVGNRFQFSALLGVPFDAFVHHYGVVKNNVTYNNSVLGELRAKLLKSTDSQDTRSITLKAKYDPEDMSRILVLDPTCKEYFPVQVAEPEERHLYQRVTLEQHKLIRKCQLKIAKAREGDAWEREATADDYARAKEIVLERPEELLPDGKKGRRAVVAQIHRKNERKAAQDDAEFGELPLSGELTQLGRPTFSNAGIDEIQRVIVGRDGEVKDQATVKKKRTRGQKGLQPMRPTGASDMPAARPINHNLRIISKEE